jgi:hypothetical protein
MPLQTQIYVDAAPGIEGDSAGLNPASYAGNKNAGPGVFSGRFVFPPPSAEPDPFAVYGARTGETADPVGFVHRRQMYPNTNFTSPGTLEIPVGWPVDVAVSGDFIAKAQADPAPQVQDWVFASVADGTVKTDPDANAAVSGHVLTGWRVTGVFADGLVIISSPTVGIVPAPPAV